MPLHLLAEYGAGIQVHVEDLAAHIAGQERCDGEARWNKLMPAYQDVNSRLPTGGIGGCARAMSRRLGWLTTTDQTPLPKAGGHQAAVSVRLKPVLSVPY